MAAVIVFNAIGNGSEKLSIQVDDAFDDLSERLLTSVWLFVQYGNRKCMVYAGSIAYVVDAGDSDGPLTS